MNKKTDSQGNYLKISEDVIYGIVEIAVKGIEGVKEFTKSKINFSQLFDKSDVPNAIEIKSENGAADITVNIVVSENAKVKKVAERIQKKVKEDIQNMTGIAVIKVNVIIDGISFENDT